jgi:hypothetical protein
MNARLTDLNRAAVIGSLCFVAACAVEAARDNPDAGGSRDTTWATGQMALRAPIVAVPEVATVQRERVRTKAHERSVLEPADPALENLELAGSWLPPLAADVQTVVPARAPQFPQCTVDGEPDSAAMVAYQPPIAIDDGDMVPADFTYEPTPEDALAEFVAQAVGQLFMRHAEIELLEAMATAHALAAVAEGKSKEQLAREVRAGQGLFGPPLAER